MTKGKTKMFGALAVAAGDPVDAITTGSATLGGTLAAVGAIGVGISLSTMAWPRAVAFFKKTLKLG